MFRASDPSGLPDPGPGGSITTVGVFDGVHLGHRRILGDLVDWAVQDGARPTVVTFADHPKQVLLGHAPACITSLDHRLLLFERAGIEAVYVLDFASVHQTEAAEFARSTLVGRLASRGLVLGFDSKLGFEREGTPERMSALGQELGFAVRVADAVEVGGRAVSSTAIREAVALGDLDGAAAMLGRSVSVLGTVVTGDKRGRDLGFPTANLDLHHEVRPPCGVYVGGARLEPTDALRPAVINVGRRPTFQPLDEDLVEVHILDFDEDLYDKRIEVDFLARLRGERRFESAAALALQIESDVEAGRVLWSDHVGG